MKIIFVTLLLLISIKVLAPECPQYICIVAGEKISRLESLIKAVAWVESKDNPFAFNPKEEAVGAFQIRQCRVDHYNKLTGKFYKLNDFYDYGLSREMFIYFAKDKSFEQAAKDWNGSGEQTVIYWNKVKLLI